MGRELCFGMTFNELKVRFIKIVVIILGLTTHI